MSSNRKVFYFETPRAPKETSEFACLPRDLAHLVFVHLDVEFLCLLKSTSRGVANACRRALCSNDVLAINYKYESVFSPIRQCNLSFPMRVMVDGGHFYRMVTEDTDLPETWTQTLIVHEFDLEFFLDFRRVRDVETVKKWLEKHFAYDAEFDREDERQPLPEHKEHISRMQMQCPRFCVEIPGEGIYHCPTQLWEHLKIELKIEERIHPFEDDYMIFSDRLFEGFRKESFTPLELAARLMPFARIGKCWSVFDCIALGKQVWRGDENSLLHMFLGERLA